jgi:hypothetical protein
VCALVTGFVIIERSTYKLHRCNGRDRPHIDLQAAIPCESAGTDFAGRRSAAGTGREYRGAVRVVVERLEARPFFGPIRR